MERLTIKTENGYEINLDMIDKDIEDCRTKLGKYEDLEEKIGCPLEVYAQLKYDTPIFDQNGDKWFVEAISKVNVIHAVKRAENMRLDDIWFSINDHKKTWWLKADRSE